MPPDDRRRQRLAFQLRQLRLVVEQVELAGCARHEQVDDALGLAGEVRGLGRERVGGCARGCSGRNAWRLLCPRAKACKQRRDGEILPTPKPQSRKKWRRVTSRRCCWKGSFSFRPLARVRGRRGGSPLLLRHRLIQVQHRPGDGRPDRALVDVAVPGLRRPRLSRRPARAARTGLAVLSRTHQRVQLLLLRRPGQAAAEDLCRLRSSDPLRVADRLRPAPGPPRRRPCRSAASAPGAGCWRPRGGRRSLAAGGVEGVEQGERGGALGERVEAAAEAVFAGAGVPGSWP